MFDLALDDFIINFLLLLCLSHVLLKLLLMVLLWVVLDGNHNLELQIADDRKVRVLLVVLFIIFGLTYIRVLLDVFFIVFLRL